MEEDDEALKLLTKALKIRESLLGDDHIHISTSYNDLGSLYLSTNNYKEALNYFNKALMIRESKLGEDSTRTSIIYYNIGKVLQN